MTGQAVDPEQAEHGSAHAAGPERRDRFTDLAFRDHRRRPERKHRQNWLARLISCCRCCSEILGLIDRGPVVLRYGNPGRIPRYDREAFRIFRI